MGALGLSPRVRVLVLAAACAAFLLDASVRGARRWALVRRGAVATGTVVRHVDQSQGFTPVVRFVTREGAPVEFSPDAQHASEDWSIGARVAVRYLPTDPRRARVDDRRHLWSDVTLSGAIALALGLAAAAAWALRGR